MSRGVAVGALMWAAGCQLLSGLSGFAPSDGDRGNAVATASASGSGATGGAAAVGAGGGTEVSTSSGANAGGAGGAGGMGGMGSCSCKGDCGIFCAALCLDHCSTGAEKQSCKDACMLAAAGDETCLCAAKSCAAVVKCAATAVHCVNGSKDSGESDVDCGGPCKKKCAKGKGCGGVSDCEAGLFCPKQDLVCCETACDKLCESCLQSKNGFFADGKCGAHWQTDPDNECEETAKELCQDNGLCNFGNVCHKQFYKTPCKSKCSVDGNSSQPHFCDGMGSCIPDMFMKLCSIYKCDTATGECKTMCANNGDCQSMYTCDNGVCKL